MHLTRQIIIASLVAAATLSAPGVAHAAVPRPPGATVVTSGFNTFLRTPDHHMAGAGHTLYSQLGDPASTDNETSLRSLPPLGSGVTPVAMASGGGNVTVVGSDGAVRGAGLSLNSQLTGPTGFVPPWRLLTGLPTGIKALDVAMSRGCTAVVADDGRVFRTGTGTWECPLASGADPATLTPMPGLPAGSTAIDVVIGDTGGTAEAFIMILLDDGRVYVSGNNDNGQLVGYIGDQSSLVPLRQVPDDGDGDPELTVGIGAGPATSYVISSLDSIVYGAGRSDTGALGAPVGGNVPNWRQLKGPDGTQTRQVVGGVDFTVMLTLGSTFRLRGLGNLRAFDGRETLVTPSLDDIDLPDGLDAIWEIGGDSGSIVARDDRGLVWGAGSNGLSALTGSVNPVVGLTLLSGQQPVPMQPPTISGDVLVGQTVTAQPGTWFPTPAGPRTYQWLVNGAEVGDSPTYTIKPSDLGKALEVTESVTVERFRPASATSPFATVGDGQYATTAPSITGTTRAGSRLTAQVGTWHLPVTSYAYQWRVNGVDVPGATARTFTLRRADAGRAVSLRITAATSGLPTVSSTSSARSVSRQIFNTRRPTITGSAKVGKRLKVRSLGSWTVKPSAYSYQWLRSGKPIGGARSKTYTLKAKDNNRTITVLVTARRAGHVSGTAKSSNSRRP